MSEPRILLVEPQDLLRDRIARQLEAELGADVIEANSDVTGREKIDKAASDSKQIDFLITHAYFRNDDGNRDFSRAVKLCEDARRNWGELPIVTLTNSLISDVTSPYGFPTGVEQFDIDYRQPEDLVVGIGKVLTNNAAEAI